MALRVGSKLQPGLEHLLFGRLGRDRDCLGIIDTGGQGGLAINMLARFQCGQGEFLVLV